MTLRSALFAILLASPALGQEKVFDFKGITNIEVRNGISVEVIQGDELSIVGTAIDGDVAQFHIRKFGPWLAVNRHTRWFIFPYGRQDQLHLTVTLPETRSLKAFDSASITASGFSGERFRGEALEGGTVIFDNFTFDEVSLYATEEGSLTISGTCDTLDAEAIIDATIAATDLTCSTAATTTRSGGTLTATATDLATQDDMRGGTITLSGDPTLVDALPEEETPEG